MDMKEPAGYITEGIHVTYQPVGTVTFDEAVARVRSAIALACATEARDLLVDTTGWTGFSVPNTFQRFLAAIAWAEEAGGRLRLAMVAREEMIDPQKFGATVANNRGLVSNIFSSEKEARSWLDSQRGFEL
jgi:hypothetical protein